MTKRSFGATSGRAWRAALAGGVATAALGLGLMGGTAHAASTPSMSDYTQASSMKDAWILPAKTYDNRRHVEMSQITLTNVKNLKQVWSYKLSDNGPTEAAPVVWNGTAYMTSAHDHVYAIDVATGKLKWEFSDNPHVISFAANRGVTLLDGNVYLATLDGHLIALDAGSGKVVFDKQTVKNPTNSFYTQVPMPYHNQSTGKTELLLGVSNGDWGGIGNIAAFDPKTGKRLWTFKTIPGPGQKGHGTWEGDSWKRGGGAVWTQMALDPNTGMLYANAGNPQPDFNISVRKGANLYTDSLLAIDISGAKPKLAWAHQFIANDSHDWDPVMPPILFRSKTQYHGEARHLVADGDKAGNFWVLDAQSGKLVNHLQVSMQHNQDTPPSLAGEISCPTTNGGVEYNGGSYDLKTHMIYLPSSNECGVFKSTKNVVYIAGQFYLGGAFPTFVGQQTGQMNAINLDTGVFAWRDHSPLPMAGGALSTSTGVVFTGTLGGDLVAYDGNTGKKLWSHDTGAPIIAPPVAFENNGKEYVAVASGPAGNQQLPDMPKTNAGARLTVFALN